MTLGSGTLTVLAVFVASTLPVDALTSETDLGITKTGSADPVSPAESLTYTLIITNPGPSDATALTVVDTLPVAVTFVSSNPPAPICTFAGGTVICNLDALAVGGSAMVTIDATVNAGASGVLVNTASVSGGEPDPDPANNNATVTTNVIDQADLAVTKTDGQTTAIPGQPLTYTIVVSNAGPSAVTEATVSDVLPAALLGAAWTCAASPGSTCTPSGAGNIDDTLSLAVGGTATYTVTGTVASAATGSLTNAVSVAPPGGVTDPNPADNNAADVDTLTAEADLGITKTGSADPVSPRDPLSYTLTITNPGPSDATAVTVSDTLPAAVTFVSSNPPSPTCNLAGSTVTCNLVSLAAGGSGMVTIDVTVNGGASGVLVSTASVSGSETDPHPANNTATVTTNVIEQADLSVTKTDGQTTAVPGQPLTFTIVVSNAGPSAVTGATVSDVLPAALLEATWICAASPGSTCTASGAGNINDTVSLGVGGTATYTVTGTVASAATGSLTNAVSVAPPGGVTDPNLADNNAADVDTLTAEADLGITKTGSADPVSPGDPLGYTLTITNPGPSDATAVTVSDTLPAAVTFVSSNPPSPTCNLAGGTVTCNLGSLAAGGSGMVTIDVTVNGGASGVLVNTASVSGSETDPHPANNTATVTTNVGGAAARPNIIVIMVDDLSVGEYEAALANHVWPNIEQHIVDAGVKFTESFVSTSLCCPSRASLLTGQVSHNSGVKDNVLPTGGATLILDEETVPVWLKRAGYRTGLVGKYLNGYGDNTQPSPKDNPSYIPPGWDDWQALTTYGMYNYKISDNGVVVTYGSSPQDYQTDVLKGRALTFIAEAEANDAQPFFLLVTPFAPHQESVTGPGCSGSVKQPVTIRPAPRHAGTLDPGVVLVPGPAFNEADMSDKPPVLRRLTSYKAIDKTCTRAFWRARLEAMMAVDELVGALVADLEAKGELADTALILTSDNGYHFGQHRFNNKILGYEESIRVPLAIRAPGNGAGQFSARMVMNTDLAPTILELAHAASAINEDGRSLVPLLVNPAAPWRSRVFGEYLGVNVPGGRKFRFIRTGPDDTTAPNDAYILWSDGAVEYYDLDADPFQLQSRHADPATLVQRNYLRGLVDQFKTCAGPACAALEN